MHFWILEVEAYCIVLYSDVRNEVRCLMSDVSQSHDIDTKIFSKSNPTFYFHFILRLLSTTRHRNNSDYAPLYSVPNELSLLMQCWWRGQGGAEKASH